MVRYLVEQFEQQEQLARGYDLVYTPHIASEKIYQTSGHLETYRENMYSPMSIEEVDYYLKPMNCPGHIMIYKNRVHSYRELPVRFAELGTVYRYERSGTLHGMLRVRGFTQDDAHIFCTPEQVVDEVRGVLDFAIYMAGVFGYQFQAYLATRPEKAIGDDATGSEATADLERAMHERGTCRSRSTRAGAPSTVRRSTSSGSTRWAASGRGRRSRPTSICRSASTSTTSAKTVSGTGWR